MRVLILHMRYRPDATGTAPLVTELAIDLARSGDQVQVIASAPHYGRSRVPEEYRGRFLHHREEDGVHVTRTVAYASRPGSVVGRALDYGTYLVASIIAAAMAPRPDVILCVSPPITVGISGWVAKLIHRCPLVFNAQDIWPDGLIAIGRLRSRPLIALLRLLERLIYRLVDCLTVVSEGMRSVLLERGIPPGKLAVIPNWIDTDRITPVSTATPIRSELGLDGMRVVLFAGNLGYASVLETVIEAAALLSDEDNIQFLIVGEGSAKDDVVALAGELGLENIHFLTTQPEPRLSELLGTADLSLVTLRATMGRLSMPSKTYAIMASGRPIVAAVPPDSGVRDLIGAAGCGVRVPAEDPQALARAVHELANDEAKLEMWGRAGRDYVVEHYSRVALTGAYRELLKSAVGTS